MYKGNRTIPSRKYSKKYLLSDHLEGYQEFIRKSLSQVKTKQFKMLKISKGLKILDVGLGRGELLAECAKKGAVVSGIDYSRDAVSIAKNTLSKYKKSTILQADSRNLPFADNSFDRVFCGDVIEHMSFADAGKSIKEIKRVLKRNGFALVHTSPNTIFILFVYPLLKYFLKITDNLTYRKMEETMEMRQQVHVDEYNLFSLYRLARKSRLKRFKIWIDDDLLRSGGHRHTKVLYESSLGRFIQILGKISIFRFFLGNDIYLKFK